MSFSFTAFALLGFPVLDEFVQALDCKQRSQKTEDRRHLVLVMLVYVAIHSVILQK